MDLSGYSGSHTTSYFRVNSLERGIEPPAVDETQPSVRLPFRNARTGPGTYGSLDAYHPEATLKLLKGAMRVMEFELRPRFVWRTTICRLDTGENRFVSSLEPFAITGLWGHSNCGTWRSDESGLLDYPILREKYSLSRTVVPIRPNPRTPANFQGGDGSRAGSSDRVSAHQETPITKTPTLF
jgi:hypothetical protein